MANLGPSGLNVFEPLNPEHGVLDSMIQEAYEVMSTEVMWWCFSKTVAEETRDSIDQMFGETTVENVPAYSGPFRVWANNQVNPIIMELTRLGGQTIKDVDLFCGIAAMHQYLSGKDPMPGDIFRLTRLGLDPKINREYDFYVVSHAWPVDLYNNRYTSWQIAAEQTNLNDVPDIIKNYKDGL